jgi:DNA-binding NtrC family response regulator
MTVNTNPQKHIFLVDDDQEDRELFMEALSYIDKSVKVTQISSGVKLMEILNAPGTMLPEIIFLDLNMPKLSGIDCLKVIKCTSKFKNVKVVMLSTYSNPEDIEEACKYGASRYYVKPTLFHNLKKIIYGALNNEYKDHQLAKRKFFVNFKLV